MRKTLSSEEDNGMKIKARGTKNEKTHSELRTIFYFAEVSTDIDANMIYRDIYCQTQQ